MLKILYIILISIIVSNCSFRPVVKHHGVPFLDKKQTKLIVNKSKFDNDMWIYIERKQSQSKLKNLGKMVIYKNNVLVLEIDNSGILKKKELYNMKDMENIKVVKETTEEGFRKNSFIYSFMSSMRQKINDPLGQRAKNREKINQR